MVALLLVLTATANLSALNGIIEVNETFSLNPLKRIVISDI